MSKLAKIVVTLVAAISLALIALLGVLSTPGIVPVPQIKFDSTWLTVSVGVGVFISVFIAALINKLIIFLAQLGQTPRQKASVMQSWYATAVSQLPFALVNLFLTAGIGLYKAGNSTVSVIGTLVNASLYTLILRRENNITRRTQLIYIGIMMAFSILVYAAGLLVPS